MRVPVTTVLTGAALVVSLSALTSCSSSSSDSVAPERPDLSGTWLLNRDASDRPGEEFRRDRSGPPGMPGGNRGRGQQRIRAGIEAFRAFRIAQDDSTVTLVSAEGPTVVFYHDGREVYRQIEGLGVVRVVSRWKGKRLQVERHLDEGLKITETYELERTGRRLIVKWKLSGGPRGLDFRRVYDRADEGG